MSPPRFAPRVLALGDRPDVDSLLVALRGRRGLVALDGAGGTPARWAILGFEPLEPALAPLPRGIAGLEAHVAELEAQAGDPIPGPFHGGFLGALSYDLGVEGEQLALPDDLFGLPRILGGLYVDFVVVELADSGRTRAAWLVLGEDPGDGRPSVAARRERFSADLRAAEAAAPEPRFVVRGELERRVPAAEHRRRVEELRDLIAAGELYQANLAHAFRAGTLGHPLDLHRLLRRASPAPYAGLLVLDGGDDDPEHGRRPRGALVSASPELLLEVRGDTARTQPIKGTARRVADPGLDAELARELLASAKDRAELAMIVDLERNDLGRVARPGGVRVEEFPALRSFAGVHHLTADVVADLAPGVGAAAVLAALFPGGSISGAPKLRAMEVIAQLEGEGRGYFTGSLGFLDLRGEAAFNVLIRTFQWRAAPGAEGTGGAEPLEGEVLLHVGGGITWRSDAAAEEEETLVKAARLLAAIGCSPYIAAGAGSACAPPRPARARET